MHDMLPRFKLFNTVYNVVDGGMVLDANAYTGEYGALHGTPFLLTGDPHFEAQTHLYVGEPVTFGLYTVELMAVDIDGNKVWLEIYRGDESIESFWMVLNSTEGFPLDLQKGFPFSAYDSCEDVNRNKVLDPGEITNIIAYDEIYWDTVFKKWVVGRAEKDIWGDYRWEYYIDDQGDPWLLFIITSFVLDGIKAFIDVHGNLGVEVHIYWLEAEKAWYNHVCSDPFATEPDYQLFLDAYQSGWDIDTNTTCQPPGTGMWPPAGLGNSAHAEPRIGNGFLDTNDGHTGYEYNCLAALLSSAYFPEQDDLDRDGGITTDCRHSNGQLRSNCTDLYDIEDPVVWHGPGVIMVELNISLCEKICIPNHEDTRTISGPHLGVPQYFTIHVSDACFDGDGIDFETIMGNESINEPTQMKSHINESGLVMTDTEFDFSEWKSTCSYNLILIGGPVANEIVRQLVDEGISLVAWEDSPGQWEYIKAPYTRCDILIVAGADRECTSAAVQELVDCL